MHWKKLVVIMVRVIFAAFVLTLSACAQTPVKSTTIDCCGAYFDPGSAALNDGTKQKLDDAIRALNKYPQLKIAVQGHTDSCPGEDHLALSQRRADAAASYLRKNGAPMDRITEVKGYGDTRLFVDTPKELPACRNRFNNRIELPVAN